MKSILYVTLPGVLAQTLGSSPVTLYNGGNLLYSNCAAKTSACDCHYASCSLSGDCACGWDDATLTCKAGIVTKCVSCPAMRRCSVRERLIIGPDGFPVPGQLSVWGGTPYPDNSGVVGQTTGSSQGQSYQAGQTYAYQQAQGQSMMSMGQNQGQMGQMSQGQTSQYFGQPTQSASTQQVYGQPQTQYALTQGQTYLSAQYFGQPQTQSTSTQQVYGQPQQTQSTQQISGQPLSLYQDNALSAGGCTAKRNACDCHYASCTANGDCLCGWDASSQTCRAGIPTQCVSCPSMNRCGVRERLLIGPDGFPVPGQLSVWGSVPYPDQSNQANLTSTYQVNTYQSSSFPSSSFPSSSFPSSSFPSSSYQSNNYQSNNQDAYTVQPLSQPIQLSSAPLSSTASRGKAGKAGKAARNQTIG